MAAQQTPSRDDRFIPDVVREGDRRTPAQRDRDRLLHCSAFRRLGGVTQVVAANEEGFLLHNRLTHTLKVAQVARRIAERLLALQPDESRELGMDADVVETAALAHDLGHPPFGHVAEVELDRVAKAGVSDAFEGNAQSFRIVTILSQRVPQYPGLNLTRATLNAILKYPWARGQTGTKEHKKWGAYGTEQNFFEFARALCPTDHFKSAEAEVMDWADDIAYSVHDVEDFYRVGFIPLNLLASSDTREIKRFLEGAHVRRKRDVPDDKFSPDELTSAFERVRAYFPTAPYNHLDFDRANLKVVTGLLIDKFVNSIKLQVPRKADDHRAVIVREREADVTILKELTWYYVINNPALATQQYGLKRVIEKLHTVFDEAIMSGAEEMLPAASGERLRYVERHIKNADQRTREKHRIAIDLVAGLTEHRAIAMYRRFEGVDPGSALERLHF
jgi:dGTPase